MGLNQWGWINLGQMIHRAAQAQAQVQIKAKPSERARVYADPTLNSSIYHKKLQLSKGSIMGRHFSVLYFSI